MKTDWNAGGNYIQSANYRVQVEGAFCPAHNRCCVCVAVTTLAQSSSYQKVHVEWC